MDHMKPVPDRMPTQRIVAIVSVAVTVVAVIFIFVVIFTGSSQGGKTQTQPASTNDATTASGTVQTQTQAQTQTQSQPQDATPTTEQTQPTQSSESANQVPQPTASGEALSASLQTACDELGSTAPMLVGISVRDLTTSASASYNGDQPMVSASMIKLIVAATFLEQVQAGVYSLDDTYTLQPSDIVGGTGTLQIEGAGATVTYRELLNRMIDVSDNVAANVLINAVGMSAVNECAQRYGLTGTQLNRLMMDTDSIAAGIENYTTANDVATLLTMAYSGSFVDGLSSELVLSALQAQEDYGGIQAGLPADASFAHKTGTLSNALHDGGIVLCDHPYVLVVLCGGDGFTADGASSVMASTASVIHENIMAGHAA